MSYFLDGRLKASDNGTSLAIKLPACARLLRYTRLMPLLLYDAAALQPQCPAGPDR